ncbi:MAG: hypothetical protein WDW38_005821 [Sanguina aurantia]
MNDATAVTSNVQLTDEEILSRLGYTQVLKRGWRKFTNISVTISAMSVLLSITSSFGTGLLYGGPVVCLWGWLLVCMLTLCQGLCMAEISSSMPTSGGMYYWMFALVGPGFWGRFTCWIVGWLNLLGQIASLSSTHFAMANLISCLTSGDPSAAPPSHQHSRGLRPTPSQNVRLGRDRCKPCRRILVTQPVSYLSARHLHIVGAVLVIVVIPSLTTEHQTPKYVFTKFQPEIVQDNLNIENVGYIFLLGLLFPAYSFTGYDGPSHMSEESLDAGMAAPVGILTGIAVMTIVGWMMNVALLFSISDIYYILGYAVDDYGNSITPEANGAVVPQIFWDAFQSRTGLGERSVGFLIIMLGGTFFCAVSTTTYVARIMYAYSRDKAVPGYQLWRQFNSYTQSPVYAVWGACFAAFLLGLIMLGSSTAFQGILSLSTIALNIAYVAPTFVRITIGRKRFVPGPFCLGWMAYPIGAIACCYVAVLTVIFSLPLQYPALPTNLNYAGVALLSTLGICLIWFWFPVYGAYAWFEGPVRTTEDSLSEVSGSITDPKEFTDPKEQTTNVQSKTPSLSGLDSVRV